MRIPLLLGNDNVALGQLVTVLALGTLVGALPPPPIKLILHSIQEELACDNCVLGHVICASPGVLIQINLLSILWLSLSLLALKTLRTLKQ